MMGTGRRGACPSTGAECEHSRSMNEGANNHEQPVHEPGRDQSPERRGDATPEHLRRPDRQRHFILGRGCHDQADALFAGDLAPFEAAVNKGVTADIAQNQFDACVIFAFNIGTNGFLTSSALKLINDPNASTSYDSLEAAWKAWDKSQGKVSRGLQNRRDAEWKIYSQGVYERW
jgi:hypothetical protein